MITTRQIIFCKELIDVVDDILHYNLWDIESSKWCDNDPKHKGIIDVFDLIVDAHNEMLCVYSNLISDENEKLSYEIRNNLLDSCIEIKKAVGKKSMEGGGSMTRTEIITRLCEMTAELTDIRENHLEEKDWMVDASLRDIAARIQLALKMMQGEKGEKGGEK